MEAQTYHTEPDESDDDTSGYDRLMEEKKALFCAWEIPGADDASEGTINEGVTGDQTSNNNIFDSDDDSDGNVNEGRIHSIKPGQNREGNENDVVPVDTSDRFSDRTFLVESVLSGSDYDSFAFLPWKIHVDESSKVHTMLRKEIATVLNGKQSMARIFSPFYNRNYQDLEGFLQENDYYWDSIQHIARFDKDWIVSSNEMMFFIAYFVNDFVMDYGKNCLKHQLLHSGNTVDEVRTYMNDGNGQIPSMISMLCADVERNEVDEDTESCLLQSSEYKFQYNSVRKTMSLLMKKKPEPDIKRGMDDKEPITQSLVRDGREDLLSIFYFAYHHYSVFREEFVDLVKRRQILLPQLICERLGKILIVQRLVYPDILYRGCWLPDVELYEEGTFMCHFFCPFILHPGLKHYISRLWNDDDYPLYDDLMKKRVYMMEEFFISPVSCEVIYWHDCSFNIKNICKENEEQRRKRKYDFKEVGDDVVCDSMIGNDIVRKSEFKKDGEDVVCTSMEDNNVKMETLQESDKKHDPFYMSLGGSKEPGYYGSEERVYIMQYNAKCWSNHGDNNEMKDLKKLRIKDVKGTSQSCMDTFE